MASTRIALRRSVIAKVALYLKDTSREMEDYADIERTNNLVVATFGDTDYAIVPVVQGEDLMVPGVSITFGDDTDLAPERHKNKRFTQSVDIRISRQLDGGLDPYALEEEVLAVVDKIQACFSDGFVEVWDYTDTTTPIFTGIRGSFKDTPMTPVNESDAAEGGDIRYAISFGIEYANLSYT